MDYIDLGRRVKELRRKQSLTQEALAEKLDISTSFLGHIERGTRILRVNPPDNLGVLDVQVIVRWHADQPWTSLPCLPVS